MTILNKIKNRLKCYKYFKEIISLNKKYSNIYIENGVFLKYFLKYVVHGHLYRRLYSGNLKKFIKSLHFMASERIKCNQFQGDKFVINLKSKSLSMGMDTDLFDIYVRQIYQKYFIFNKFIDDNEVFLDLGANIGLFGLYAATRAAGVRGYLFEPGEASAELLAENIAINNFQDRLKIIRYAVSDVPGRLYFSFDERLHTVSSTSKEKPRSDNYEYVDCITVDGFVNQNKLRVSAIKFDLEGHERFALSGMAQLLAEQKPRLAISSYHLPDDIPTLTKIILELNPKYKIIITLDMIFAF